MKMMKDKEYTLILVNGWIINGKFLGQKDKKIDFYDYKYKDTVEISEDSITMKFPIKKSSYGDVHGNR